MSKPHSDPFDQGGQVTHQHVEADQHSELRERLEMCEEQLIQAPYRAPVAVGWYAQDVRSLLEQKEALESAAARLLEVTDSLADETPIKEAWLALWAELNADSIPATSSEPPDSQRSRLDVGLSNQDAGTHEGGSEVPDPATSPSGEQTREQLLERLALTVKTAIDGGSFDGTLFESQVSGTLWLLYGEQSPASSLKYPAGRFDYGDSVPAKEPS